MAALLVGLSLMALMLGIALPIWQTITQREREAELVFRGEQYVHAIDLFSRRTGGFPTSLEALQTGRFIRRLYKDPITGGDFQPVFLGQAGAVAPGSAVQAGQRAGGPGQATGGAASPTGAAGRGAQAPAPTGVPGARGAGGLAQGRAGAVGPIIGVVSRSTGEALRLYNGRGRYNEWLFVATAATQQAGAPAGAQAPGVRGGGPAQPGGRGGVQGRGVPMPGPSRGGFPSSGFPSTGRAGAPAPASGPARPGQ